MAKLREREVIILRGVSGAGKSTYAKTRFPGRKVEVCSADDFFVKDGKYSFSATLLGRAHGECMRKFISCLQEAHADIVIVDNTNTTIAEIAPYMAVAQAYEWDPTIVTIDVDDQLAEKRNVHGVFLSTIQKQLSNIKKADREIPRWWKHVRENANS